MEVASKRYIHDHLSSYKNRGDKLGTTNRFVRALRTNEDRKTSRRDELTKIRGIALLNEKDASMDEVNATKTQKSNVKSKTVGKAKPAQKENVSSTDQRKLLLMKWREQRELKKKAEVAKKTQKAAFTVQHIQHNSRPVFEPFKFNAQPCTKKAAPKPKENAPAKRVTRASARLVANKQQPAKPVTRARVAANTKENQTTCMNKPVAPKKKEEQPKRVTRQSARVASVPSKSNGPNHKVKNTEEQPCTEMPEKATPVNVKKQQRKSFAPANFQFTAPIGLSTFESYGNEFKFEPLSPSSAEDFFKGVSLCPSAKQGRELITKENFIPINATDNSEAVTSLEKEDDKENISPVVRLGFVDKEQSSEMDVVETAAKVEALDGSYFRNLISSETERLNGLSAQWEKVLEMNEELSEEVKGNIRTAVGQAQLLISQRFKQFSGLIDLSEDETAEKKATMSDLQGFWDMIYFQVEDVNNKMDVLDKQKQNGWVVETQNVKKAIKKTKKITTKKAEAGKGAKPEAKSRIKEIRAAMKAKMAEKKRQIKSQDCSFITVLTPVKKKRKSGCNDDVMLTPVRRSLRNTPINQSASRVTPKIVSTPKTSRAHSPGLRLTPEVTTPPSDGANSHVNEANLEPENKEPKKDDSESSIQPEIQIGESATESTNEDMIVYTEDDEGMTCDITEEPVSQPAKQRSCLRSSSRRTRKSSRVFFQSPEPSAQSTAGGTPGPLIFTPGAPTNKHSSGIVFTPVAVSFDSPVDDGNTCSTDAGHTPAMVLSGQRSLRGCTFKGTPISGHKRHLATPDSMTMGTPVSQVSKRRSLRRSGKANTPSNDKEAVLPAEYILPSACSESDDETPAQALTPIFANQDPPSDDRPLLAITPLKDSSDRLNRSNLTPCSRLQALNLDDSLETRRDSVFFAPSGGLIQQVKIIDKDNLICFSPLAE